VSSIRDEVSDDEDDEKEFEMQLKEFEKEFEKASQLNAEKLKPKPNPIQQILQTPKMKNTTELKKIFGERYIEVTKEKKKKIKHPRPGSFFFFFFFP